MVEDLLYPLTRPRLGLAVVINNLDKEQEATRRDVQAMATVLKDIGFDVEVHRNLTSQGMNQVKRKFTEEKKHKDANCFLLLVISHGTVDNFLQDCDGARAWNLESLVTEVCDVNTLVGKPKMFFIEACRGKENNFSTCGPEPGPGRLYTKSSQPAQPSSSISLPSKQDVFVGFATVPGFVSFTGVQGSPYLQSLASLLQQHHTSTPLSDIHLLVKRRLANMKLGREGARQGAEERSSLLSKLLFSRYEGQHKGSIKETQGDTNSLLSKALSTLSMTSPSSRISSLLETTTPSLPSTAPFSSARMSPSVNGLSFSSDVSSISTAPFSSARVSPSINGLSFSSDVSSISIPIIRSPITVARSGSREDRDLKTVSMDTQPSTSPRDQPSTSPREPAVRTVLPPRSAFLSSPSSSAYPAIPAPVEEEVKTSHVIEVNSTDVEGGLKQLLEKVLQVYGGEGKVKMKENKSKKNYFFKYLGPEKAASLLETAIGDVKELQAGSGRWRFTQRIEVTAVRDR